MTSIEAAAAMLARDWCYLTLAEMRRRAEASQTGIAFTSLRQDRGLRAIVMLCATSPYAIHTLTLAMSFADDAKDEDWARLTVSDLATRSMQAGCTPAFAAQHSADGAVTALSLICADPISITSLESLLVLPK